MISMIQVVSAFDFQREGEKSRRKGEGGGGEGGGVSEEAPRPKRLGL